MKFVKDNLTLVICGAVILLAVASVFYPTGYLLDAGLQKDMSEHYNTKAAIKTMTNKETEIPGGLKIKGPPSPEITSKAAAITKNMEATEQQVVNSFSENNRQRFVAVRGEGDRRQVTPELNNIEIRDLLPRIGERADSMSFKQTYGVVFDLWMTKLVGTKIAGVPPDATKLGQEYDDKIKAAAAALPAGANGGFNGPGTEDPKKKQEYERQAVSNRASDIHMYVDTNAFQQRAWYFDARAPREQEVFEGLVDAWLQGDVVAAIFTVNDNALRAVQSAEAKNVGSVPIKRLESIVVGNAALTSRMALGTAGQGGSSPQPAGEGNNTGVPSGNLFFTGASAPQQGSPPPPPPTPNSADAGSNGAVNTIDYNRTMTGRASGSDYDVVMMQITLDMDPAYVNQFVEQLYRQNIGYTVVNMKMKAVDPLEAMSSGYLYGEKQVVQVEFLVEGLLFRNWTLPLMPESIRMSLGIPAPK